MKKLGLLMEGLFWLALAYFLMHLIVWALKGFAVN